MTDCVLLVHDDPTVLRTLGSRLEQAGAEVVRETSVDSALRALVASHPDVVCIGVQLAEAAEDGRREMTKALAREVLGDFEGEE